MKSKITKLDGTSRQFNVEVAKEVVSKMFDEVLADIRKEAILPGFRKGNAPMDMIRKNYMKDAEDEVKRRLIPQAYQQALDEHDITPVSYPEVWDVKFELSGAMTFKAKADMQPEVRIADYRGIKVRKDKVRVSDDELNEALSRIRNMFAEMNDVDRPIQKGDFGVCDTEIFIDGRSVSKKRENMFVEADKDASFFGIGEELCGLAKGDLKDIDITLPENYPDKKFAGKKAVFKLEIKGVKEKKVPALDDELAKKMGKENIEDVRKEVGARILESKEEENKVAMKDQIVEFLLKKHSFDIPPTMVDRQLEVLLAKAEEDLVRKGADKSAIESNREDLRKKLLGSAKDKVKLYFILDKIAEQENIAVSEEDSEEWLKALATSLNRPFESVKKYYEEHDLIGGLNEQLREEKTLELLLDEASVTEK